MAEKPQPIKYNIEAHEGNGIRGGHCFNCTFIDFVDENENYILVCCFYNINTLNIQDLVDLPISEAQIDNRKKPEFVGYTLNSLLDLSIVQKGNCNRWSGLQGVGFGKKRRCVIL